MPENICINTILEIRKLSRFLDKYSKYLDNHYNVTLPQMLCLYEINMRGTMNLTELTKLINLNNSAITGIVDRLEAKGYVIRVKKPGDRRTVYLEITPNGKEYTAALVNAMDRENVFHTKTSPSSLNVLDMIKQITSSLDPEIKNIELPA